MAAPSPCLGSIQVRVGQIIDELISSLPDPGSLSACQRRGIVARYTAVLEGNFIYWMTGAYLAARTEESRSIILENVREEVRDCHPGMMRRFAAAAQACPTDSDFLTVYRDLSTVRLFVGQLSPVSLLLMMTFFEGFIQRFMAFLEDVGTRQGSVKREYTQVHGVCDIAHTEGLFRALEAEMALKPAEQDADLFAGVGHLRALIETIVHGDRVSSSANP
jgi:Iron-containing redox enzyme